MNGPGSGGGRRGRGGPGRGRGVARGDVRIAVLTLLGEQPMHGYQIISEITDRSNGVWEPSPGSIYPLLQQLTDEGLVKPQADGDRKVFSLTDEGRATAGEAGEPAIWDRIAAQQPGTDLREAIGGLAAAAKQVARTGSPDQRKRADEIIAGARKQLYQLLADG